MHFGPRAELGPVESRLSWKRWPIMVLFSLYGMAARVQTAQFVSKPALFAEFHQVSSDAISWTSLVHFAITMVAIFPSMAFIDSIGLKRVIQIGSGCSALGCLIKCVAIWPEYFWFCFVGQILTGVSLCFILPMPSKIALTWFPSSEMSLAASVGTAGFLSGWGVGYLLPVYMLKGPIETFKHLNETSFPNNWRDESVWGKELTRQATQEVSLELRRLYIALAVWTSLLFLLVCMLVDSAPENYPSIASEQQSLLLQHRKSASDQSIMRNEISAKWKSIKTVMSSGPFILLLLSGCINTGVFNVVAVMLNQILRPTFDDSTNLDKDALIGLMAAISLFGIGTLGSIIGGYFLDKYKRFKLTSIIYHMITLISLVTLILTLEESSVFVHFITIACLGIGFNGICLINLEFGVQLTYPEPEEVTGAVLTWNASLTGVIFTQCCQTLLNAFENSSYVLHFLVGLLTIAIILLSFLKENLKRGTIQNSE